MTNVCGRYARVTAALPEPAGLLAVEFAARVCRGTVGLTTPISYKEMIPKLIWWGHESPLEHYNITMLVRTSRDVMCEMTRHRCGLSFSVESQRAVPGVDKDGIFICLPVIDGATNPQALEAITHCMNRISDTYAELIGMGWPLEAARGVLPNCAATTIVVTGNCRAWRHFFKLRTAPDAYPAMRETARLMLEDIRKSLPETYELLFKEFMANYETTDRSNNREVLDDGTSHDEPDETGGAGVSADAADDSLGHRQEPQAE